MLSATLKCIGRFVLPFYDPGGGDRLAEVPRETRTLLEVPGGIARDPDVHFSGKKILFALRRDAGEDWHLWEINADGSGLRQLTRAPGVCDFDPIYLPDDSILFSSTREPKYSQCSQVCGGNPERGDTNPLNLIPVATGQVPSCL